jgi:L-threonylcarbamoyladenylate synthase
VKTKILRLDPAVVDPGLIADIASVLLKDGVMAYPTETFYGLGAAGFSAKAVPRIYKLKSRDTSKPLSLVASDLDMVREIAGSLTPAFWSLAREFWPGPLTLVLEASPSLPPYLLGPGRSVAVRIPAVAWLRRLAYELSQPVTATSANLSGEKEISSPAEVIALFDGKIELVVDGGLTPGAAPSTLLDVTGPEPHFLREGVIPSDRIRAALGI